MKKLVQISGGLAALLAALIGLFSLGTWRFDAWQSATFGPDYIPMAPATAALFVLLGLALTILRWLRPDHRLAAWFSIGAAVVTVVVAGLVLSQPWSGRVLPWDAWFTIPGQRVGAIPVGRMSPWTAMVFLLAAISMAAQGTKAANNMVIYAGHVAAGFGLFINIMAALAYGAGTPLGYESETVPMAVLTAYSFITLNLGFLLSARLGAMFEGWLRDAFDPDQPAAARRFIRLLVGLTAGALILIGLAGFFYLRSEQMAARRRVFTELESIAALKAEQVAQWRRERLQDGRYLQGTPTVARSIAAYLAHPDSPTSSQRMIDLIAPIKGGDRYREILLFDAQGHLRLTIPTQKTATQPKEIFEPKTTGLTVTLGPMVSNSDGSTYLDVRVPIVMSAPPGEPSRPPAPPLVFIILRANPAASLYPLIQNWPVPSATAETLLVRPEGAGTVFLHELSPRGDAPPALRRPSQEVQSTMVRALRDAPTGRRQGIDYRGSKVLAVGRIIPDSPWYLIAKVDQTEAYAGLRLQAAKTAALALLLMFVVLLAAAFRWRLRHLAVLRRALEAEKESGELARRLTLLTRYANDIIVLLDGTGRIIEANERALAAYGYTLAELQQLPLGGLRPPEDNPQLKHQLDSLVSPEGGVIETVHRRKDGTTFPVEISGRAVELGDRSTSLVIIRDLTELKVHEAEIGRMNRLYAALSQVNQTIVHATTRETLLRTICQVVVEFGRFPVVWIGWAEPATGLVVTVAKAGAQASYLEGVQIRMDDSPEAQGPTGRAIRENRTQVCTDFLTDPTTRPWHAAAQTAGIGASISLPLRVAGQPAGVLVVYAASGTDFGPREIALLEEAALDISFGLGNLERERLREASEIRYRRLFESAKDGILILDYETGRVVDVNPFLVELLGSSRSVLIEKPIWDLGFFRDLVANQEAFAELQQHDYIRYEDKPLATADGRRIDVEFVSNVYRVNHQKVIQCNIRDLSGRKRAEAAAQSSEARFRAIFDYAPVGISFTSPEESVLVNAEHARITGVPVAESNVPGIFGRASHPEDYAQQLAEAAKFHRGEVGHYTVEKRYLHPDGQVQWAELTSRFYTDPTTKKRAIVTIITDIAERKQAEEQLRLSEERYRLLFDHNPLPMWLYDTETLRFIAVNDTALKSYGYSRDEFLALTIAQIRPEAEVELLQKHLQHTSGPSPVSIETRHRRKDGSVFTVEIISRPLDFGGFKARLVMAQDITAKKNLEEQYLRAQRLESLGQLASGIAHDLNNMLAPVLFAAPLLRDSVTTERDLKILDTLELSAVRGASLVRQIVAFAQGTSSAPRITQLKHIVRDVVSILEVGLPRSITLKTNIAREAWPAEANPTQIHQVVLNLGVNARDAMPEGGILHITVSNRSVDVEQAAAIPEGRSGDWLVIEVSDTGTGIPAETLPHIWSPFFTTKPEGKGTGLGLGTVRSIVASHLGFIQLETTVGQGTTFRVFLPASREAEIKGDSSTPVPAARGRDEFILVVDDDAMVREIIKVVLTQQGYRVLDCADGVEAIVKYNTKSRDIRLVITDVDMPNLNGAVLAGTLRKLNSRLPIIAMSGLASAAAGSTALKEVKELANAFLPKPFTASILLTTVQQVIATASAPSS